MYEIAIILINYNTSSYTIECIESIYKNTSDELNFQVIVVDNCSAMNDYLLLEKKLNNGLFKNLVLLRNDINSGFGGGNMFGANHADAKFLAFINNDVVLLNDCFSILLNQIKSNKNIGVCGPKNYTTNGNFLSTLDHYCSVEKEIFGRKYLEFFYPKECPNRRKEYNEIKKGQIISGSFMVFNAIDFWTIGGFDENIFLYHEETDLCLRLKKINKFAYFVPNAKIIHHHGASSKKSVEIKTEIKISLLYVIKKHYGYFHYKILLTYLQLRYLIVAPFKPKYAYLLKVLLNNADLSYSLRNKKTNE